MIFSQKHDFSVVKPSLFIKPTDHTLLVTSITAIYSKTRPFYLQNEIDKMVDRPFLKEMEQLEVEAKFLSRILWPKVWTL